MKTRKALMIAPALISAMALSLAGCAKPPTETSGSGASGESGSGNGGAKACMVSDSGGFDDKSFNQTSHKGLEDAVKKLGIETAEVESQGNADFAKNVQAMVDAKCTTIITVGFLLSDATVAAAKANPDIDFAIVDDNPEGAADLKNLKPLVFNTAQSSFMAGYLAAATTKTNKVGTFGGMNIPTVTIFMDGFARGVEHYNEVKDKDVKVLGWDKDAKTGSFTGDFKNVANGKTNTANFINEGADIVMPVAGPVGLGTLDAVREANQGGKDVKVIWPDSDGYESTKDGNLILTSVKKNMGQSVADVIAADLKDEFSAEPYVGTLENKGVELAPFHDFEDTVPQELKDELKDLEAKIVSGELKVGSEYSPEA